MLTENNQLRNQPNIRYQRMDCACVDVFRYFENWKTSTKNVSDCLGSMMDIVEKWDLLHISNYIQIVA